MTLLLNWSLKGTRYSKYGMDERNDRGDRLIQCVEYMGNTYCEHIFYEHPGHK